MEFLEGLEKGLSNKKVAAKYDVYPFSLGEKETKDFLNI